MGLLDIFKGGDDRDRFAADIQKHLRSAGWPNVIEYDREAFVLRLTAREREGTIHLDTLFRDWQATPKRARAGEISKIVASILEGGEEPTFDEARESLLPVIRNREHFESLKLDRAGGELQGEAQPLADILVKAVVIDTPAAMKYVSSSVLGDWGQSMDELLPIAMENLRAISPFKFEKDHRGFYVSAYGDYHDASRILLPHLFEQFGFAGEPVAIVLSRAAVAVADSADAAALEAMGQLILDAIETETRPVSFAPILLRNGEWRPFEPTAATPTLVELTYHHALWIHQSQKTAMEARLSVDGRDIFVGSLMLVREQASNALRSIAVWPRVPTYLPSADVVMIEPQDGGDSLARAWHDVASICELTREPDLYPPRWYVAQGPTAD